MKRELRVHLDDLNGLSKRVCSTLADPALSWAGKAKEMCELVEAMVNKDALYREAIAKCGLRGEGECERERES